MVALTGPSDYPHPYPQHQTFSWAVGSAPQWTYRERSHMRLVIDDVGRNLAGAKNTKELVRALRDAMIGMSLVLWNGVPAHTDL